MIENYFKTTLRFFIRNISFTVINLLGLTFGISAFILIVLYIQNEISYDKNSPEIENIYRLVGIQEPSGIDIQHVAQTSAYWSSWLLDNDPDVKDVFRVMYPFSNIVEVDDEAFRIPEIFFADNNALVYLGFPILAGGNPADMLTAPNSAAISEDTAVQLFGKADVVGSTIRVGEHNYVIKGIYDNKVINSHLQTNVFLSLSTVEFTTPYLRDPGNNSVATYLILHPGAESEEIVDRINAYQAKYIEENAIVNAMKNTYYLQPFRNIYLDSSHIKFHTYTRLGNRITVAVFMIIAFLVLQVAIINFINLSTANSAKRGKETGVRKILGADRRGIIFQFLGESMIISLAALLLALGFVELVLPYYNGFLGTEFKIDFVSNPLFGWGLLLIWFMVGLEAGIYPAFVMSGFQAISLLKPVSSSGRPQSGFLRKALVVFQFLVASGLILTTLVVSLQVRHLQTKNMGFNETNIISVSGIQNSNYEELKQFKDKLDAIPGIVTAGIASGYNGVAGQQSTITTCDTNSVSLMVRFGYVDPDFFPVMEIPVIEGRNFSYDLSTDRYRSMIINSAAQKAFGWSEPVGKRICAGDDDDFEYYTVIGVIEDYHYYSLHQAVEPAIYIWNPDNMRVVNVRYDQSIRENAYEMVKNEFDAFFPGKVFYASQVSEILQRHYQNEKNVMSVFAWFSVLCILISCLGLLGLTYFMVNTRRKEISIRRVLGGSVMQVNLMLIQGFLKLVVLSNLVGIPVALSIMYFWLDNFASRIIIGPLIILTPLLITLTIATISVVFISTRASLQNPADTLKYE